MKTTFLKITAIMLLVAGSFCSCENRKEESDGNVSYAPCPCEDSGEVLSEIKGETTLFINSITADDTNVVDERMAYFDNADYSYLRLKQDNPNLSNLGSLNGGVVFHICNFPDFAKQWKTQGGITVYYEGVVYPDCEEFGCRYLCYSLILKKLKIKEL